MRRAAERVLRGAAPARRLGKKRMAAVERTVPVGKVAPRRPGAARAVASAADARVGRRDVSVGFAMEGPVFSKTTSTTARPPANASLGAHAGHVDGDGRRKPARVVEVNAPDGIPRAAC